eukprot:gene14095-18914_t
MLFVTNKTLLIAFSVLILLSNIFYAESKPTAAAVVVQPSSTVSSGTSLIAKFKLPTNARVSLIGLAMLVVPYFIKSNKSFLQDSNILFKLIWGGSFLINWITVSIPGRFDSSVDAKTGKPDIPWNQLFEPATWAFAIWGVIYLSEIILTGYAVSSGNPTSLFKNLAPYWMAGNIYQSLWCFAFRPDFRSYMWLPMLLLASGSISLVLGQMQVTHAIQALTGPYYSIERLRLLLIRLPFSIHSGWLAAASLLNLNGWVTLSNFSLGFQTAVAFASCYIATAFGGFLTIKTGDPMIGLTIAWALAALAQRTTTRTQKMISVDTQQALAITQNILSKAMIGNSIIIASKPLWSKYF